MESSDKPVQKQTPHKQTKHEQIAEADSSNEVSRTQQLVDIIDPIIDRVQGIVGKVKGMAWIYLAGAFVLWGVIFLPLNTEQLPLLAFSLLLLVVLGIPSVILFLFHAGLQSIIALPARLLEKAGIGEASARTMVHAVKASNKEDVDTKKKKLVGTVFELRTLVMESKDMLIEYTALLRLANPFVLGIVGVATLAGFGVTMTALISLLIAIL